MAHLHFVKLDSNAEKTLLQAAWQVIHSGLSSGIQPRPVIADYSGHLQQQVATFITLSRDANLRGCCGTVHASQTLIEDVMDNTWRTAFSDHRFKPLVESELPRLVLEISVLSALREVQASDQQQLLSNLRPGIDGLLICSGNSRATFLPKVWDSLPDPERFLQQLMLKAGMPMNRWPEPLEAFVYTTGMFGEQYAAE